MSESNDRMMTGFEVDREKYQRKIKERSVTRTDGCWEWTGPLDVKGYGKLSVGVYPDVACIRVHKVAYYAFNPDKTPQDGLCVCHHCDNPCCVNPDHLFEGTNQDNVDDKVKKGRQCKGENHLFNVFSEETVLKAIEMLRQGIRAKEIAKVTGMSARHIRHIATGRKWKHLTGGKPIGKVGGYRILSEQDKKDIQLVFNTGNCTKKWLAELYGVSQTLIGRITDRCHYRRTAEEIAAGKEKVKPAKTTTAI